MTTLHILEEVNNNLHPSQVVGTFTVALRSTLEQRAFITNMQEKGGKATLRAFCSQTQL